MTFSATFAAHRSALLGHEHHAEAAFADLLQELVPPDLLAGSDVQFAHGFGRWRIAAGLQEALFLLVHPQQFLDPLAQGLIARADLVEVFTAG